METWHWVPGNNLVSLFNSMPGWFVLLQASVGLVISLLLLVDLSLTLLMLLQFYSISLAAMLGILLVLPFASVIPSAAGLNALFSHGPRRSAALARIYALWNITSFVNLVSYPILAVFLTMPTYVLVLFQSL